MGTVRAFSPVERGAFFGDRVIALATALRPQRGSGQAFHLSVDVAENKRKGPGYRADADMPCRGRRIH
jgi:hypothetical protein